jgi:Fe-S oxidoreductase
MSLEEFRSDMETCRRCSPCKFIPFEKVTGFNHVNICPSIAKYEFHSYSGGGRMVMGTELLGKRLTYTPKLMEIIYNCHMCGGCDTSCKYSMDMEVIEPINEIRIDAVESGHSHPALDKVVGSLKKNGTMVPGARAKRGGWAQDLGLQNFIRDKVDVIYHAGCQTSFNKDLWKLARSTARLLQKANVNFGIGGTSELCCGGRAFQMGYKADFMKQAQANMAAIRKSGAKTLVTGCAECYFAFKVLYDRFNLKGDLEVLHTTEYFARLIKDNQLKPRKKVDLTVTYHDPCHLGRQGEPYIHWNGKIITGDVRIFDPPRERRRGTYGVYEPPREVLRSIPNLKLVEMDRIKEYAWCCGAGGGVKDTNPEFALWTGAERVQEAEQTGAAAIATACPWCEKQLGEAAVKQGSDLKVYDIVELLDRAI